MLCVDLVYGFEFPPFGSCSPSSLSVLLALHPFPPPSCERLGKSLGIRPQIGFGPVSFGIKSKVYHILEPLPPSSCQFLLCSSQFRKSPPKIASPKICLLVGFCVVLLVLIHGSVAILVDLPPFAFLRPNFSFFPFNLVSQVEFFRPNRHFPPKIVTRSSNPFGR